MGRFLELLEETNRKFNLTAVSEHGEMWIRHIADSLSLLPSLQSIEPKLVADVGSGGGLPAIPLAIAMPGTSFSLIESTGKKARYLTDTAATLGLANVHVLNGRAEVLARSPEHRERYDAVTARALGRLEVMLDWTVPLAKPGGWVLAMKGEKARQEIDEAKQTLHAIHASVGEVQTTPTGVIVPIEKRRPTPRTFPRSTAAPQTRTDR